MRILILTQWYPPEPMRPFADLAKGLQQAGHEVSVLTGFPNWPGGKLYPGYKVRPWKKETIEGIPVLRVFLYANHSAFPLGRILNLGSFVISAVLFGRLLLKKPDLIHAVQPPTSAFAAWVLSWLWGVRFTYDLQDMWPESLKASGLVRSRFGQSLVGKFTMWVLKRASAIRVISLGFRENLIRKGVPAEKVFVASNWVDTALYRPRAPDADLAKELRLCDHFNVMYAGVVGLSQGLDTVVDAAALVPELPGVQFVIVGEGTELPRLRELAQKRGLKNVRFLGRKPLSEMPGLYALADALLVSLRDDPLFRITVPHKVFTCMASGKPIIAALEGEGARIIERAQAGITCKPGSARELASAVQKLHSMKPSARTRLGENGRRAVCGNYTAEVLIEEISQNLQRCVAHA